jgi:hypothetical protein
MDDKQEYLRWLEEMWDVQKFDLRGSTEREEERTEEVLEVFRGLARLSKRHVEPRASRLESCPEGRTENKPGPSRPASSGVSPEARTFHGHRSGAGGCDPRSGVRPDRC